jgi:hypothetical protein
MAHPDGTPPTSTVTVFLRLLIAIVGILPSARGKANSMEQAMVEPAVRQIALGFTES